MVVLSWVSKPEIQKENQHEPNHKIQKTGG